MARDLQLSNPAPCNTRSLLLPFDYESVIYSLTHSELEGSLKKLTWAFSSLLETRIIFGGSPIAIKRTRNHEKNVRPCWKIVNYICKNENFAAYWLL